MAQTNDPDTGKDQIVDVHGQPTSLHTKKHQNIHGTLDIYEALDQDFLDCEWLDTLKRDPVEKFCCCGVFQSLKGFLHKIVLVLPHKGVKKTSANWTHSC